MSISVRTQLALLALVTLLPWLPSLDAGFVFDDTIAIVDNPVVNGAESPWLAWTRGFWGERPDAPPHEATGAWRPLTVMMFAMDWRVGGGSSRPFHVANVLLHLLATLAAFWAALRHGFPRRVAWLCALAFGVHALHAENVAGLAGRADVLATALTFVAWGLLVHERRVARVAAGGVLLLALCAKESAISLAGIAIVAWSLGVGAFGDRRRVIDGIASLLAACACWWALKTALFGAVLPHVAHQANPLVGESAGVRLVTSGALFLRALGLFAAPLTLSADYSFAEILAVRTPDPVALLGLASLGALLIAIPIARRDALLSTGLCWLGLAWLPLSNAIAPLPAIFAERLLYLPSFGACILIALGADAMLRRPPLRRVGLILVVVLCSLHVVRGGLRALDWRSNRALFEATVEDAPRSARAWYFLGLREVADERWPEAVRCLDEAVAILPRWADALTWRGVALDMLGRTEDARRSLEHAVAHRPGCAECRSNLDSFRRRHDRPPGGAAALP